MNILIVGATGNIGLYVTQYLLDMNIMPFVGARSEEKVSGLFGDKVVFRKFDFTEPSTFRDALHGIDRLFFVAPLDDMEASVREMLAEAQRAGVGHVTFSSGRTTGDEEGKDLFKLETLVRSSGIPWTIIRPSWFMQNFTGWLGEAEIKKTGELHLPAGDGKTAFVDVRDIAEVVVKTLTAKGHESKVYELTGHRAYDHFEVMGMLREATGQTTAYIPMSRAEFIAWVKSKGKSDAYANYTANLYEYVKQGKEAEVSPDIEIILGKRPRTLPAFIRENKAYWER